MKYPAGLVTLGNGAGPVLPCVQGGVRPSDSTSSLGRRLGGEVGRRRRDVGLAGELDARRPGDLPGEVDLQAPWGRVIRGQEEGVQPSPPGAEHAARDLADAASVQREGGRQGEVLLV